MVLTWSHILLAALCCVSISITKVNSKRIFAQTGFPVAIFCDVRLKNPRPKLNEFVQCLVSANDTLMYNQTIKWKNRKDVGYFFDASHSLDVTVSVISRGRMRKRMHKVIVQEPTNVVCPFPRRKKTPMEVALGKSWELGCWVDEVSVSKEQFEQMSFESYKDCKKITDDRTRSTRCEKIFEHSRLGSVKVGNATYDETPGLYHFSIIYKGKNFLLERANMYEVCVVEDISAAENPIITTKTKRYEVAPGSDLTVHCYSKRRRRTDTVYWYKEKINSSLKENDRSVKEYEEICRPGNTVCKDIIPAKTCKPVYGGKKDVDFDRAGQLNSVYVLRNVSESDSGNYSCALINGGERVSDSFEIVVKYPIIRKARLWTTVFVTGGICFTLTAIMLVIRFWMATDVAYIKKKFLTEEIEVSGDQVVAHLIYSDDVFHQDLDRNPLNHVTQWLSHTRIPYSDANALSTVSRLEVPAPETAKEMIGCCMSLVIFVTDELLKRNELEIFSSYLGFNSSVESGRSIIFVCTKEMKHKVMGNSNSLTFGLDDDEKKDVERTIKTFRNFFKSRNNHVVFWTPNNMKAFHRALYVALPKVKVFKETKDDSWSSSFSKTKNSLDVGSTVKAFT